MHKQNHRWKEGCLVIFNNINIRKVTGPSLWLNDYKCPRGVLGSVCGDSSGKQNETYQHQSVEARRARASIEFRKLHLILKLQGDRSQGVGGEEYLDEITNLDNGDTAIVIVSFFSYSYVLSNIQ